MWNPTLAIKIAMVLAKTAVLGILFLRLQVGVRLTESRIQPCLWIPESVVGGGYQMIDLKYNREGYLPSRMGKL